MDLSNHYKTTAKNKSYWKDEEEKEKEKKREEDQMKHH